MPVLRKNKPFLCPKFSSTFFLCQVWTLTTTTSAYPSAFLVLAVRLTSEWAFQYPQSLLELNVLRIELQLRGRGLAQCERGPGSNGCNGILSPELSELLTKQSCGIRAAVVPSVLGQTLCLGTIQLIPERESCFLLLLPAVHRLWNIGKIKVQVKYNTLS